MLLLSSHQKWFLVFLSLTLGVCLPIVCEIAIQLINNLHTTMPFKIDHLKLQTKNSHFIISPKMVSCISFFNIRNVPPHSVWNSSSINKQFTLFISFLGNTILLLSFVSILSLLLSYGAGYFKTHDIILQGSCWGIFLGNPWMAWLLIFFSH
jgi:hypothetical protein